MFKCSRTPSTINPLQVSRRCAVTQAVCCVLFLAQPGGPDTHHCLASLVCRRSADDPTLTRHHDQTPNLIGRHCCGFDVSRNNTHTPSWGWIFNGHIKSPRRVAEGFKQLGAVPHTFPENTGLAFENPMLMARFRTPTSLAGSAPNAVNQTHEPVTM